MEKLSLQSVLERTNASLKGNWKYAIIAITLYYAITIITTVVYTIISLKVPIPFVNILLYLFLFLPLEWGLSISFLNIIRGENIGNGSVFQAFNKDNYSRVFETKALQYIFIFLWGLLFYIPGIIKSISYAMTDFILKDNPDIKNDAVIEKSMKMMNGHKAKFFLLYLSVLWPMFLFMIPFFFIMFFYSSGTFTSVTTIIAIILLAVISIPLGLWCSSRWYAASAHFYEMLKEETQQQESIVE